MNNNNFFEVESIQIGQPMEIPEAAYEVPKLDDYIFHWYYNRGVYHVTSDILELAERACHEGFISKEVYGVVRNNCDHGFYKESVSILINAGLLVEMTKGDSYA